MDENRPCTCYNTGNIKWCTDPRRSVTGDRVELKQWDADPIAVTQSFQTTLQIMDANQTTLQMWIHPEGEAVVWVEPGLLKLAKDLDDYQGGTLW